MSSTSSKTAVVQELVKVFDGAQAHATFEAAVKDFPVALRGVVPAGASHSAWQIVEHIRFAQRDILDYSRVGGGVYKEAKWPDDYWHPSPEPPTADAWDKAVRAVGDDRRTFEEFLKGVEDARLTQPFAWGDGQTLLREALLLMDHAAYHVGELVLLRRLLGAWK